MVRESCCQHAIPRTKNMTHAWLILDSQNNGTAYNSCGILVSKLENVHIEQKVFIFNTTILSIC